MEAGMKLVQVLVVGLIAAVVYSAGADDKKAEGKKAEAFDAAKLAGKWQVTGGKKAGNDVSDEAKKGVYVITKDKITIMDGDQTIFEIKYAIVPKTSPAAIDMEITKSPNDGANGSKAKGITALSGDELKICYPPMGGDRPTKFDGSDKNHYFVLRRVKAEKKDK
jgi:uncharacterized protein (TIGR03067 family)